MGGQTLSTSDTRIEALQLQSSAYGVTLPVMYGVNRIAGNLIWYGGFKATPHTTSSGGKGGVKTQNTTFTYSASVMMGLCEGQISGVSRAWKGKQLYSGGPTPAQILTVSENYTPSGSGIYTTVHSAAFAANVQVVNPSPNYDAGQSAFLTEGIDYTRVGGVYTFPSSVFGLALTITYQYLQAGTVQSALTALGLTYFSGALAQATWSYLTGAFPAQAIGYSGIAYVCAQDYSLGTTAQVDNHTFEVQGPMAYSVGTTVPDANPASFALDLITNGRYGANFPSLSIGDLTQWSNYCLATGLLLSPVLDTQMACSDFITQVCQATNTAPVWSGGRLKFVPYGDKTLTANGATYTPNNTPVYDLNDDDFVTGSSEDPVEVTRASQVDSYNHIKVEYLDRANLYNVSIAEAKDTANIEAFGLRTAQTIVCHWCCDAAVARAMAQLALQRTIYVRNTYKFRLSWAKALLEPMDLVTITDGVLGYAKLPVRIISIDEGDDLKITAEDFPLGIANAAVYPSATSSGFQHDYNASPGSVSTPRFIEPPGILTTSGLEVWAAVRGVGASWGGCRMWISMDGTNYREAGVTYGGARYGTLTGPIAAGVLPVSILGGALTSGSAADAAALSTLCYIGGATPEWLAFQTAALTGGLAYNLSGLNRAAYGSSSASAHANADPFVRVDDGMLKSGAIDPAFVGKTLHFKFTSFNLWGGAEQSLASATDYTYVVTGTWSAGNAAYQQSARLVTTGTCAQLGATVYKNGGASAWDSGWYSIEGYTGGAVVTGTPQQSNAFIVFGLSQNPAASVSYANIDYGIEGDNAGNVYAQELGVATGIIGSYGPFDQLSVEYDGLWVYYLRNGAILRQRPAPPGLKLYAQGAYFTPGGSVQTIKFGSLSSLHKARGVSLVDASWWKVGVNPLSQWNGNQSGSGAVDQFVNAVTPDGVVAPVWQATSGSPGFVAGGGGWNQSVAGEVTNSFPVDQSKTYLFACFIKQPTLASGQCYWGLIGYDVGVDTVNTTTQDLSPYFFPGSINLPAAGRWYLMLGYVFPQGSTGNSIGRAGVYDCVTGLPVPGTGCQNFNWRAGNTKCSTRAYQYYCAAGNLCQFSAPQVYLVDGSEPAFEDLMSMVVNTARMAANAATDPSQAAVSSNTFNFTNSVATPQLTNFAPLSYTNSTGGPITVELTASAVHTLNAGAGASNLNPTTFIGYQVNSGGFVQGSNTCTVPNGISSGAVSWNTGCSINVALNAGDVLDARIQISCGASNTGTGSNIVTSNAALRLAALKR